MTAPSSAIDPQIVALAHKALADERLAREEAALLFALDAHSAEAYYLHWAAHQIARRASEGRALIYAQLGLDANPCAGGCAYCSFAESSNGWDATAELPRATILAYCRAFDAAGVHLISLMTTDSYPFEQFVETIAAVRATIRPQTLLMANIGDFDGEQARRLKAAGTDVVYHALRLGEGVITAIPEARRRATIAAIQEAGLTLMSGVEPVYAAVDGAALLDRMLEVSDWPQFCSGLCPLRRVAGTPLAEAPAMDSARYRLLVSLFRLLASYRIPYGSENTLWCNGGTNPRDTQSFPDAAHIAAEVALRRRDLQDSGWQVP